MEHRARPLPADRRSAPRRRLALVVVAGLAVTLVVGLAAPAGARDRSAPAYAAPGPYAAGVTTLDLPDRKVEVWYPTPKRAVAKATPDRFDVVPKAPAGIRAFLPAGATATYETDAYRDVPAATRKGGFPLVLMAHGFSGYREQLAYLGAHLASWGFVVASPDVTERGLAAALGSPPATPVDDVVTMRNTEALLRAENDRKGGPLRGRVRADGVAITGHSAGGGTALRFGAEPGVVTAIPISASGVSSATGATLTFPPVPVLFVTGAAEQIVPLASVQQGFAAARPPARLVVIDDAGHADIGGVCPVGGAGGLVGVARSAGLPVPDNLARLATDGCTTPATDPDPSWGPVKHAVTAQLRAAFGIDKKPVGLDQATMDRFAPVGVRIQERR